MKSVKVTGYRMPHGSFHAPRVGGVRPMSHVSKPPKAHPSSVRVRLPRGDVNTSESDPGVYAPGVGRF